VTASPGPLPGNLLSLADSDFETWSGNWTAGHNVTSVAQSAAEAFTYDLKMLKRATLVGETTAGGAHAANLHSIGSNFYVATIEVRAINPYSRYDWNDTGIEPDVKVSEADALKSALQLLDKRLHVE